MDCFCKQICAHALISISRLSSLLLRILQNVLSQFLNLIHEGYRIEVIELPWGSAVPATRKYTNTQIYIWVKFLKVYIFPKYCHFFCNFDSCLRALFALVRLSQLFLRVNHMCRSRENQVFDPSPQVRYLKSISKHGRFWGF